VVKVPFLLTRRLASAKTQSRRTVQATERQREESLCESRRPAQAKRRKTASVRHRYKQGD